MASSPKAAAVMGEAAASDRTRGKSLSVQQRGSHTFLSLFSRGGDQGHDEMDVRVLVLPLASGAKTTPHQGPERQQVAMGEGPAAQGASE